MKVASLVCFLLPLAVCAGTFEASVRPVDGDATATLQKALDSCFLSGGGVVTVDGVDGPSVRSWGGVAKPSVRGLHGVEPKVVDADAPFFANPI